MQTHEAIVAIIGLLVSFGLPVVLAGGILYYKHRKLQMTHETIARLAEKGLPVPPELLEPPRRGQAGLRAGLIQVGLGIALAIFFLQVGGPWSLGLIPGLMGVAMLVYWAIEKRTR